MYLLIDNCSLVNFVHSHSFGKYLLDLESQVNRGNIQLLTHENILDEWKRHRSKNKDRIVRKLLGKNNQGNAGDGSLLPSTINADHIDLQNEGIDRLLKMATVIATPPVIEQEFSRRYKLRLAPFHKKLDSQSDWEIIGSAAHYCLMNRLPELYFLSSNDTDFADPAEPGKAIHPHFKDRFPELRFHYFRDIPDFMSTLAQIALPDELHRFTLLRNETFSFKASVRNNDLDSLYHLLKYTYEEVAFIPPHLLRRYYPFSKSEKEQAYFSLFGFYHVRPELIALFEAVSVEGENVTITKPEQFAGVLKAQEKLEFVMLRLTNNLIFNLSSGGKRVETMYHGKGHCDCIRCAYNRLEWAKSLAQITTVHQDQDERLKTAYFAYQFGQHHLAARQLADMRDAARGGHHYMLYYICQYNLYHLGFFLQNTFQSHDLTTNEIADFRAIDLFEEAYKLKSKADYDLLTYIADGNFFKSSLDTIVQQVTLIEDHYQSFLNGGWSSNSHVGKLITEFAELESFVQKNFVIYDAYDNWQRLTGQFIKGLFASHAMRGTQNSALDHFDDFLINALVFYGTRSTILLYFNRYNLKDLAYERGDEDTGFLRMTLNLIQQEKAMRSALDNDAALAKGRIFLEFNRIFQNLMLVAALMQADAFDVNVLGDQLLRFLKTEASLNHHGTTGIADFLSRKGKLLEHSLRQKMLTHLLTEKERYEPDMLLALIRSWPARPMRDTHHVQLLSLILTAGGPRYNPDCHHDLLSYLGRCSNQAQKARITDALQEKLAEKFNFDLYYYALIFELIPLNQQQLFDQLNWIDPEAKRYSMRSIVSGREEAYLPHLDELLNLCFKYEIPVKGRRFSRFKKRGPYYVWLLDMDRYDYRRFQIEWVTHYPTEFYFKVMGRSPKLMAYILKHLRTHTDQGLERALIRISFYGAEHGKVKEKVDLFKD